jgi:ribosomal protein S18 acetylase RimI-like enzyme
MKIEVKEHAGGRSELRPLFELAEDSASELDGYIDAGRVLVALEGDRAVGQLQLIDGEIKNMAVLESHQRRGIGRALIGAAIHRARQERRSTLVVATATADIGNLRFYQRLGFRMREIERDAFTAANGYEAQQVDGIPLRDRVWLDMAIA